MDRKPTEAEKETARLLAAERGETLFFVPLVGTKPNGMVFQTAGLYSAGFVSNRGWFSTWNTGEAS
jgi:hypothetical protein